MVRFEGRDRSQTDVDSALWLASVNPWDCDEMGHLNVRHYVRAAQQGVAALARDLGLDSIMALDAEATLEIEQLHIRFLREAQVGTPLALSGRVLWLSGCRAEFELVLRHGVTADILAGFKVIVCHATAKTLKPFGFRKALQASYANVRLEGSPEARARSLPLLTTPEVEQLALAVHGLGPALRTTAAGSVEPSQVNAQSRFRPDSLMGLISDGAAHFYGRATQAARLAHPDRQWGRVMMECRMHFLKPLSLGGGYVLKTGLAGQTGRIECRLDGLFDAQSQALLAIAACVGGAFDLQTRRLAPYPEVVAAALRESLIPEMAELFPL